ncbi:hypothetical protein O9992_23915 [Vibrio lentus]|nr:hypothetical protein [Vibrio lentus]
MATWLGSCDGLVFVLWPKGGGSYCREGDFNALCLQFNQDITPAWIRSCSKCKWHVMPLRKTIIDVAKLFLSG